MSPLERDIPVATNVGCTAESNPYSCSVGLPDKLASAPRTGVNTVLEKRFYRNSSPEGPDGSRQARKKVLVVIPTLSIGGAETDLVRNLPVIDRSRFEIVICTFLERGPLAQQLIESGIEIVGPFHNVPGWCLSLLRSTGRFVKRSLAEWRPKSGPEARLKEFIERLIASAQPIGACLLAYPAYVRPVADLIRDGRFEVVHAILPYSYLFATWANQLAGPNPLIMSRVSQNWYHKSDRLLESLERYVLHPRANAAICNSEILAKELQNEGIPRSKIRVIYNGIDLPAYSKLLIDRNAARAQFGIDQDDLVFSSVANLYTYKGHADLLRALHKVSAKLPHAWILLVVGRDIDGNLLRLIELRDQLGLKSRVRFLGERLDVPAVLSASDIHVSASHTEGLPNNILEAMSCGLPVVATAVGGVPELVVDGVTGLLPPARDVNALGTSLLALANNVECRDRMGRAGHKRVATCFSIARSVAAYEQIYQDVLADRYRSRESSGTIDLKRFLGKRPEYFQRRGSAHKTATRGIIIMMHEVNNGLEDHARELATGLTGESLYSIVTLLRRDRWDIVTMEEALARLSHEDTGHRFAVLSFDDGYRDTLTRALPILEQCNAPFTVYIPTGAPTRDLYSWWLGLRAVFQTNDHVDIACMGNRFECRSCNQKIDAFNRSLAWVRADYRRARLLDDTFRRYGISLAALNEIYFMNERELRILSQHHLAKIGAHTASHNALSFLSFAAVREEFVSNRHYLEELLSCRVVDLAYPYGEPVTCGPREFALATEVGFRSAVTSRYGAVLGHHRQLTCELPRIAAGGNVAIEKFSAAIATL